MPQRRTLPAARGQYLRFAMMGFGCDFDSRSSRRLLRGAAVAAQTMTGPSVLIINGRVFTGVASAPGAEVVTVVGDRFGATP